MSDMAKVFATLASAIIVFCIGWILVGFTARAVATLFCLGYGC